MSEEEGGSADSDGALSGRARVVIALALLGALAGFLWGVADVPRYSASATVLAGARGDAPRDSAQVTRLVELARGAEVATEAAGRLGNDFAGADLLSDVSAAPAATPGAVAIEASAESPDFASATANGFAAALVEVAGKGTEPGATATIPDGPSENRSALLWSGIGLLAGALLGALLALAGSRRRTPSPASSYAGAMRREPDSAIERRDILREQPPFFDEPVEDAFGAPVLASFDDPEDLVRREDGVLELDPGGGRALAGLAEALGLEEPEAPRTLAVLDATPDDGAERVALGLAIVAGGLGLRVLVVEADLRHPSLAAVTGVAPAPGLRDYLQATAGPRDVLRSVRTVVDGEEATLVCVPSGERRLDLPGGIAGGRFEALVERLPRVYDLVVFTGPAASLGGDAVTLARSTEAVVLVAAEEEGASHSIAEAVDTLALSRLSGGVLTRPRAAQEVPQNPS